MTMSSLDITVEGIFTANTEGSFVSHSIKEVALEFGGIRGDRHFGVTFPADARQPMYPRGTEILNKRQISILAMEEVEKVAEELGIDHIRAEWLGANLLVKGIPELTKLPVLTRFLFPSGAGLINEGENKPCIHAGNEVQRNYPQNETLARAFVKKAMGRRGIVCSVERPEAIRLHDKIKIMLP
jgi:hypothetical protein